MLFSKIRDDIHTITPVVKPTDTALQMLLDISLNIATLTVAVCIIRTPRSRGSKNYRYNLHSLNYNKPANWPRNLDEHAE
jgi:hypothetical protein